jgi:two-component system chemotaxis sensor kinase CheA
MKNVSTYIHLPREMSPFERRYVTYLNKIALFFFYAHLPVFMLVAWVAGTGPWMALILSIATLIGPSIAYFTLENPRTISVVYGITAMLMGGLLVHFGQGPVQIEMHFYFFALLAMLCMFANPTVNIVAAVTVALHHLILWWLLPSSVFNYAAEWWVVGVHAAFVVLETVAACFIAREFFDNVIGLEKIIEARTEELHRKQRDMRLILDHIDQGLITIDLDGHLSTEASATVFTWFGTPAAGATFHEYLRQIDTPFADWFELALESVKEDVLPVEVTIHQLPKQLKLNGQLLAFHYQPIFNASEKIDKLLLIITDITQHVDKQRAEQRQQQLLRVFEHLMENKVGFLEFFTETDDIITTVYHQEYKNLAHVKRLIHTVKGNASLFGIETIATLCHDIESECDEHGTEPTHDRLATLHDTWQALRQELSMLLGSHEDHRIEIDEADYAAIVWAILNDVDKATVSQMITSWKFEPMTQRLKFVKQQLDGIAKRLGKEDIVVTIDANDLRTSSEHFAAFWLNFVHVLRNAVDHGIETAEERQDTGKHGAGHIEVKAGIDGSDFIVEITDDGRGIDWDALYDKARELGLPASVMSDHKALLFGDGVTTKDTISEFSGRGVGMGAVREACAALDGVVEVRSKRHEGTSLRFIFPKDAHVYEGHAAMLASAHAASGL